MDWDNINDEKSTYSWYCDSQKVVNTVDKNVWSSVIRYELFKYYKALSYL